MSAMKLLGWATDAIRIGSSGTDLSLFGDGLADASTWLQDVFFGGAGRWQNTERRRVGSII
jgi:hypothetical protein